MVEFGKVVCDHNRIVPPRMFSLSGWFMNRSASIADGYGLESKFNFSEDEDPLTLIGIGPLCGTPLNSALYSSAMVVECVCGALTMYPFPACIITFPFI